MSSQAPSLLVIQSEGGTRARLIRRAKLLSWLSIGWMTIEAAAAIVAALIAGSVALLGFGLDSLIELASASTILWLYSGARRGSDVSERRAQQIIAGCFAVLAVLPGVRRDQHPRRRPASRPRAGWGWRWRSARSFSCRCSPTAKGRVAAQLGSVATAGDAAQSWLCAISAAAVLVSIVANSALGWWWLDPITGIGIAALAVHEGRRAWAGEGLR